jgi:hypothetical protein
MKQAGLTHIKNKYIIHSFSKTTTGLSVASNPYIMLNLDISKEELINSVFLALNGSQTGIPHPTDWVKENKIYYEKMGLKRHKDLYDKTKYCSISLNDLLLTFLPTRNGGTKDGFQHLNEKKVFINSDDTYENIYSSLMEALSRCE